MAGHSKWSKVKRFKGALDTKRGALFSKLSREITIAAKTGGGDPDGNARLRSAILSARAQSMPNDNIDRAIKRGTGEGMEAQHFDEIVYEGYAAGGVAVIVGVATDGQKFTFIPDTTVPVHNEAVALQILRLCDSLEEDDDVQNVYSNLDISDELLAKLPV